MLKMLYKCTMNLPPTENLCDCRKCERVVLAPLGSDMHLEMCQSLWLTAKATLGQRSAPGGIGQILHNKK